MPENGTTQAPPWLSDSERTRLATRSGAAAGEFLASRWLIRQALAAQCERTPDQCHPVPGRPVISAQPPGLALSLSHSHALAACGTHTAMVGIDIEPLRRRANWQRVVRRWFTPAEQEWLLAADDPTLFLRVWTLKEAWLKATGRGIAGHLQTLEVAANFELTGDRPDLNLMACCGCVNGFLVTLVYETPDNHAAEPPSVTCFEAPDPAYSLDGARLAPSQWQLLCHHPIRAFSAPDQRRPT